MAAQSEDFVILACTVLIQITSVTDRQADRQTDAQAIANMCEAYCYHAQKRKEMEERDRMGKNEKGRGLGVPQQQIPPGHVYARLT